MIFWRVKTCCRQQHQAQWECAHMHAVVVKSVPMNSNGCLVLTLTKENYNFLDHYISHIYIIYHLFVMLSALSHIPECLASTSCIENQSPDVSLLLVILNKWNMFLGVTVHIQVIILKMFMKSNPILYTTNGRQYQYFCNTHSMYLHSVITCFYIICQLWWRSPPFLPTLTRRIRRQCNTVVQKCSISPAVYCSHS